VAGVVDDHALLEVLAGMARSPCDIRRNMPIDDML
jgi:hypothetical protein